MDIVRVQEAPFILQDLISELTNSDPAVGAVVSFMGIAREMNHGSTVSNLWLEHYPGMTESSILEMIDQAKRRFGIVRVAVVHRIGYFEPTDPIVAVVVTSAHRGEAFSACEFLMDYLKVYAPFWKKETTPNGTRWVDARQSDDLAAAKWGIRPLS